MTLKKTGGLNCQMGGPGNLVASRLLVDLDFWRALMAVGDPVRRVLLFYKRIGRNIAFLAADVQRVLSRASGQVQVSTKLSAKVLAKNWRVTLAGVVLSLACATAVRKLVADGDTTLVRKKQIVKQMAEALTYKEWSLALLELDRLLVGESEARTNKQSRLYDRKVVEERLAHLLAVSNLEDPFEMMFTMRADLLRNLGNMTNRQAISMSHWGLPWGVVAAIRYQC